MVQKQLVTQRVVIDHDVSTVDLSMFSSQMRSLAEFYGLGSTLRFEVQEDGSINAVVTYPRTETECEAQQREREELRKQRKAEEHRYGAKGEV